jgi:hypothetical protein
MPQVAWLVWLTPRDPSDPAPQLRVPFVAPIRIKIRSHLPSGMEGFLQHLSVHRETCFGQRVSISVFPFHVLTTGLSFREYPQYLPLPILSPPESAKKSSRHGEPPTHHTMAQCRSYRPHIHSTLCPVRAKSVCNAHVQ